MISFLIGIVIGIWGPRFKWALLVTLAYGIVVGITVGQIDHRDGAGFFVPIFALCGLLLIRGIRWWQSYKPITKAKAVASTTITDDAWYLLQFMHGKITAIWVMQNRLLEKFGLLETFKRHSWLYVVVFFVLSIIAPPLAIAYAVVGFFALVGRDNQSTRSIDDD